jgi:hypothetical protein
MSPIMHSTVQAPWPAKVRRYRGMRHCVANQGTYNYGSHTPSLGRVCVAFAVQH